MAQVIQIPAWNERYEVNEKGGAWRPGERKRAGGLMYLRMRVQGPDWSRGYRAMVAAGSRIFREVGQGELLEDEGESFGEYGYAVHMKALEFSARLPAELRGYVLVDERGCEPYRVENFAADAGFSVEAVRIGFEANLAAGWWKYRELNLESLRKRVERAVGRDVRAAAGGRSYFDVCGAVREVNPAMAPAVIAEMVQRLMGDMGVSAAQASMPRGELVMLYEMARRARGESVDEVERVIRVGCGLG